MQNNSNKSLIPSTGGLLANTALRLKLVARLIGDSRVGFFSKLLPLGALAYLFSPIDAISIPIIGAVDDVAILSLGAYFFIEMCPPDVVKEHLKNLISNNSAIDDAVQGKEEIIDAEVKEDK